MAIMDLLNQRNGTGIYAQNLPTGFGNNFSDCACDCACDCGGDD